MKSKTTAFLAAALCLALCALLVAAPTLLIGAGDKIRFSDGATGARAALTDRQLLVAPEMTVPRALYIDHIYVNSAPGSWGAPVDATRVAGTEDDLTALKAAGIVPPDCVLVQDLYAERSTGNACAVYVEPVSGVVVGATWSGAEGAESTGENTNGIPTKQLIENYIAYLGLSVITDWVEIEFKDRYFSYTTVGRYSPGANLYLFAMQFPNGTTNGIQVASHTPDEMAPLFKMMAEQESK